MSESKLGLSCLPLYTTLSRILTTGQNHEITRDGKPECVFVHEITKVVNLFGVTEVTVRVGDDRRLIELRMGVQHSREPNNPATFKIEAFDDRGKLEGEEIIKEGADVYDTVSNVTGYCRDWVARVMFIPEGTEVSREVVGTYDVYVHKKYERDAYYGTVKITEMPEKPEENVVL